MSDRPTAILAAVLFAAPACALCVVGPAAIGGAIAGMFDWIGDLGTVGTAGMAFAATVLAYGAVRHWRTRRSPIERASAAHQSHQTDRSPQ